jgi:hypothetical protein
MGDIMLKKVHLEHLQELIEMEMDQKIEKLQNSMDQKMEQLQNSTAAILLHTC